MIDEKKLIEGIEIEVQGHEGKEAKYYKGKISGLRTAESLAKLLPKIGEWIPCSERLPTAKECQKNDCRFILDDGNRRYQGTFDYTERYFTKFDFWKGIIEDKCVIAWQPLPEPYKPNND